MKLVLLSVVAFVNSLYFEITDKDKKCFIEELPDGEWKTTPTPTDTVFGMGADSKRL